MRRVARCPNEPIDAASGRHFSLPGRDAARGRDAGGGAIFFGKMLELGDRRGVAACAGRPVPVCGTRAHAACLGACS
ncbi:hypothetical protein C7T96_11090 [Nitratireductor sp. StC3]|nr:hypothetical protein C7T96_11090 [Nitratireductor sp. StC3]